MGLQRPLKQRWKPWLKITAINMLLRAAWYCYWCGEQVTAETRSNDSGLAAVADIQGFFWRCNERAPSWIWSYISKRLLSIFSVFVIAPISSTRYFWRTVEDCANGLGDITLWHRFCTDTRWEMSLCIIEGLASELAVRKGMLFLNKSIKKASCTLGWSCFSRSHITNTVVEILCCQTQYALFNFRNHAAEVDLFKREKLYGPILQNSFNPIFLFP